MTLRKLLMNFALYGACLAFGGVDAAAEAAASVARAVVGGEPIAIDWSRGWKERLPFDCPCLSGDRAPVAPACPND